MSRRQRESARGARPARRLHASRWHVNYARTYCPPHQMSVHTVRACDSYHVCTGGECVLGAAQENASAPTSCRCANVLAADHCSSTYMLPLVCAGVRTVPSHHSSLQLIVFSPHSKLAMMARLALGLLSRAGFAQAPSARVAVCHVVVMLSVSRYYIMVLFS